MRRPLTILVDADDTIECLLEAWLGVLNERYGANVALDDVTEWDVSRNFPQLSRDLVYEPLREGEIWERVQPRLDAVEYLKKLKDDGHKIYIVTATHHANFNVKMEQVLLKYFPYIKRTDVIVAYNKSMVRGDVRVDDGVHNLENCNGLKILIDMPHNRGYDAEANDMHRVSHWRDVYELITQYSEIDDEME